LVKIYPAGEDDTQNMNVAPAVVEGVAVNVTTVPLAYMLGQVAMEGAGDTLMFPNPAKSTLSAYMPAQAEFAMTKACARPGDGSKKPSGERPTLFCRLAVKPPDEAARTCAGRPGVKPRVDAISPSRPPAANEPVVLFRPTDDEAP